MLDSCVLGQDPLAGCHEQGKGPSGVFPPKMRGISGHCLLLKRDSVQWNWHSLGLRNLSCL